VPAGGALRPPRRSGSRHATSIALGVCRLPDVTTHLYRDRIFPREDGLLGNGALGQFGAVWIDSIRNRLVLEEG
ncbi:MAG: hypothetical protein HKO57_16055, partial [Akkermansiaceae bacterium]|nr:hypothetical protein [Akkermansiaceae bacterium]